MLQGLQNELDGVNQVLESSESSLSEKLQDSTKLSEKLNQNVTPSEGTKDDAEL